MAGAAPQFPFERLPLSHWREGVGHHNQGTLPSLSQDNHGAEEHVAQASPRGVLSLWDFNQQQCYCTPETIHSFGSLIEGADGQLLLLRLPELLCWVAFPSPVLQLIL